MCKKGKQEEGVRFLALKLQEKQIKTFNGVWGKAGVFLTLSSGFILIKIKIKKMKKPTLIHSILLYSPLHKPLGFTERAFKQESKSR